MKLYGTLHASAACRFHQTPEGHTYGTRMSLGRNALAPLVRRKLLVGLEAVPAVETAVNRRPVAAGCGAVRRENPVVQTHRSPPVQTVRAHAAHVVTTRPTTAANATTASHEQTTCGVTVVPPLSTPLLPAAAGLLPPR